MKQKMESISSATRKLTRSVMLSRRRSIYWVYIATNREASRAQRGNSHTVLYTGKTNNLKRRLLEHKEDAQNEKKTFAGKYNCYNLLYCEKCETSQKAAAREKEIKGWRRSKKLALCNQKLEHPERK